MQSRTKRRALSALSVVLFVAAAALVVFAAVLIHAGAYPAPGEGSLGHVGAVIAGVVAGFAGIVTALFGLWARSRARAVRGG